MRVLERSFRWCVAIVCAAALLASQPARADQGGYVDPGTGLVWSPSQSKLNGYRQYTWDQAQSSAASYQIWDYDAAGSLRLYDDWRMPTVSELQSAIYDGTLELLWPKNSIGGPLYKGEVFVWSSEAPKGKKYAWVVRVVVDDAGHIVAGGEAVLFHRTASTDVFFVRP